MGIWNLFVVLNRISHLNRIAHSWDSTHHCIILYIIHTSIHVYKYLVLDHPYVSYEDALTCTGLETLSSRRHNSSVKFISKLRWEEVLDYNPLAHIARTRPQYFDHNYYLRIQPINKFITNTERFRNFVNFVIIDVQYIYTF